MSKVKPETVLPIIIEVTGSPADAAAALSGMGFSLKYTSKVLPLVYGYANGTVIQVIAGQGFVKEISYDEPTFAL